MGDAAWESWRLHVESLTNIIPAKSGIFSAEGGVCVQGSEWPFSQAELKAIREAILKEDTSIGRMIGGQKFMHVGGVFNGVANFKKGQEGFSIFVGPSYTVAFACRGDNLSNACKDSAIVGSILHG